MKILEEIVVNDYKSKVLLQITVSSGYLYIVCEQLTINETPQYIGQISYNDLEKAKKAFHHYIVC
jgi:hypothetical protein